jgi:hypothetical protein
VRRPTTLYLDVSRIPKHASFTSLVLIPRTFETIGTLECLEPAVLLRRLERSNAVERLERFLLLPIAYCLLPIMLPVACRLMAVAYFIENRGASLLLKKKETEKFVLKESLCLTWDSEFLAMFEE